MKGDKELAALVAALDGDASLELALGEAVGRFRSRRAREIMERQAADLLHEGWRTVAERQGVCKATVYNRAGRGRTQSKESAAG